MLISILAVLIPPTNVRKPSSPISPTKLVATIAACDEPNPGKKAAMKPTPVAAETDLTIFLLEIVNGFSICGGIFDFWRKLTTNIEKPNNPDNKGNKGCFKLGKPVKTINPRQPEIINAAKLLSLRFPLKTINKIIMIKKEPIIV